MLAIESVTILAIFIQIATSEMDLPCCRRFWGPSSQVISIQSCESRIILSAPLAKFRQNRYFRQNFHRLTTFVKSVKIVNKISSNLPFSIPHAFLDVSLI